MAQTPLNTTRLIFHAGIFIFLIGYMVHLEVPIHMAAIIFVTFIFYELFYLSYIIVNNLKQKTRDFKITGKRILITGGSSGIGFELAKLFVKDGCSKLILVARNEGRLKEKCSELRKEVVDATMIQYLALDLSSDGEKISEKLKKLGTIDLLVNCAGFSMPGEFQNLPVTAFEEMMKANYLSSVHTTHALVPGMIEQRKGQVVFLSSVAGQLGVYGFTAYAASKYALRGFAEVLYHELRPYNVGVTLAFPPDTNTPGYEKENETKPKLCRMISEQAGLWEAVDVAKALRDGIVNRKFMLGFGSDGYFMNAMTGNVCPANSLTDFWIHLLLTPFLKLYMLFLQNSWNNMIENETNDTE